MGDHARAAVLVIGESLVDIVETPGGDVVETPGGSPLNVAITLARLGIDTHLLTALGQDERADRIEAHLRSSGVALVAGAGRLPRTSTAAARMQPDGSASYEFDVSWEPPETTPPRAVAVHAGSLALFVDPGAGLVRRHLEAVDTATDAGTLVTLDPNIRPSLLPGRDVVLPRFEELLTFSHLVKLSDEDATWLYPDLTEQDVVRHLLDRGQSLVALTRGARGCIVTSHGATVELPPADSTVVDTIGAGDSFMGALIHQVVERGLVSELVRGRALPAEELAALGRAACEVAAVTVSRRGADPPRLAELGWASAST